LRGPELPYAKREGVKRILYLGDSVTFGWLLDGSDTFPQRVQRQFERVTHIEIETINAGVGGYSPWQEHVYLSREGLRYDPDLVILGFVLNDVTEKFELARFGGRGEGTQLAMTADTLAKRLSAQSALAFRVRRLIRSLRSPGDSQAAARRAEELQVSHLVSRPEDPRVREAWQLTLENVGKIFQLCRERDIPVVLMIFPFVFQFEDVARLSGPQAILTAFAREQGVPALDLLPLLAERLERAGAPPDRYFFDADHLTPSGSEAVARVLVAFLRKQGLVVPN
jgi:lysophospholipase L1-like esterase